MIDIEQLKSKILDLAISGKLVPQDPNDEPASVLLERIQKEKEELVKTGKLKKAEPTSVIYKGSDNRYYENSKKIDFIPPLKVNSGIVWVHGYDFLRPMETKLPEGNAFSYIDIDSIDNKKREIKEAKILPITKAPSRARRKVFENSTLFSMVRPYLKNIAFVGEKNKNCIASTGFFVCTPTNVVDGKYLFLLMQSAYVVNGLNFFMKGDNSPSINSEQIYSFLFPIPSLKYQQLVVTKTSSLLRQLDDLEIANGDMQSVAKKLRNDVLDFYFDASDKSYYKIQLGKVLNYQQPGPYIVKSTDYSSNYKIPVLTAGKTFILGYTNEKEGVYRSLGNKVIIFDDFTTSTHLVDFDFKVKSSAMKILSSADKQRFDVEYFYFLLQTMHPIMGTHKRFWISEFANRDVLVPDITQQKQIVFNIKKIFNLIDNLIN
jgi:restriction endonuclease S subunit